MYIAEKYWNNSASYGTKRPSDERDALLHEILMKEDWIMEGVYYDWIALLKWTGRYQNHNLIEIKKKLQSFPEKTIYIHSVKEANQIV